MTCIQYIAICKNFEPFIYISIYIYGVHCGKGPTKKITSSQSNVDKHVISSIYWGGISSCGYMLMIFLRPGMFSKTKTFPQCTPYMYILIYIKGSKFLQTAIYIYICLYLCFLLLTAYESTLPFPNATHLLLHGWQLGRLVIISFWWKISLFSDQFRF